MQVSHSQMETEGRFPQSNSGMKSAVLLERREGSKAQLSGTPVLGSCVCVKMAPWQDMDLKNKTTNTQWINTSMKFILIKSVYWAAAMCSLPGECKHDHYRACSCIKRGEWVTVIQAESQTRGAGKGGAIGWGCACLMDRSSWDCWRGRTGVKRRAVLMMREDNIHRADRVQLWETAW